LTVFNHTGDEALSRLVEAGSMVVIGRREELKKRKKRPKEEEFLPFVTGDLPCFIALHGVEWSGAERVKRDIRDSCTKNSTMTMVREESLF
jgi:hypothetical protein